MAVVNNDTVTGNYKINGVTVLDPQLGSKPQINITGVWYRNMNADRIGYVVANMKKLTWVYTGINETDLAEILSIIYRQLEDGKDTFTVTSYIIGKGVVTDLYYLGAEFNPGEKIGDGLYKLELHWIQVNGKKTL